MKRIKQSLAAQQSTSKKKPNTTQEISKPLINKFLARHIGSCKQQVLELSVNETNLGRQSTNTSIQQENESLIKDLNRMDNKGNQIMNSENRSQYDLSSDQEKTDRKLEIYMKGIEEDMGFINSKNKNLSIKKHSMDIFDNNMQEKIKNREGQLEKIRKKIVEEKYRLKNAELEETLTKEKPDKTILDNEALVCQKPHNKEITKSKESTHPVMRTMDIEQDIGEN